MTTANDNDPPGPRDVIEVTLLGDHLVEAVTAGGFRGVYRLPCIPAGWDGPIGEPLRRAEILGSDGRLQVAFRRTYAPQTGMVSA